MNKYKSDLCTKCKTQEGKDYFKYLTDGGFEFWLCDSDFELYTQYKLENLELLVARFLDKSGEFEEIVKLRKELDEKITNYSNYHLKQKE